MRNTAARTAQDLMHKDVETTFPNATVVEATAKLNKHGISNLPVIDGQARLLGIFSEADALKSMVNEIYFNEPSEKVKDVMRRYPLCISADTEIFRIATLLTDYGFRHLPVIDGDKLVGIISRHDVLIAIEEALTSLQISTDRKTYSKLDDFPNLPLLK